MVAEKRSSGFRKHFDSSDKQPQETYYWVNAEVVGELDSADIDW